MSSVLIALIAGDRPAVGIREGAPKGTITWKGVEYDECTHFPVGGMGAFLGFYDWLRTSTAILVGLRLTLATGLEALAHQIPERPYIRREGIHTVNIVFASSDDPIDEVASADQDFGASRASISDGGTLLLAFDASCLTDEEAASIRGLESN